MSKKFGDIIVRSLAGIGFVGILVAAIMGGVYSFSLLLLVISILGQREFYRLQNVSRNNDVPAKSFIVLGAITYISLVLDVLFEDMTWLISLPIVGWLLLLINELYRGKKQPIENLAMGIMGIVYTVLPFYLLLRIGVKGGEYSFVLPLSLFLCIWVNDTFAYLTGISVGKHRLFERISPKKSWEGAVGGVLFSLLLAVLLSNIFPVLSLVKWIGFAFIVVVVGTYGDLLESLMKRSEGVKDSGNLIPGHGGILDRLDSTILAAPAAFVYLHFFA